MVRISKPPEERKQEIIDTAINLFIQNGYENTSFEDIAKELDVVKGLIYRYFSSKQELFNIALSQYVHEYCIPFVNIIRDYKTPAPTRLLQFMLLAQQSETNGTGKYHDFLHTKGNEQLHEQLTIKMCQYLTPYIADAFEDANLKGEISVDNPRMAAEFIMYGQIALWECKTIPIEEKFKEVVKYVAQILNVTL